MQKTDVPERVGKVAASGHFPTLHTRELSIGTAQRPRCWADGGGGGRPCTDVCSVFTATHAKLYGSISQMRKLRLKGDT